MKKVCIALLFCLAAAATSCAKSSPQTTNPPTVVKADDPTCPLIVPGTSVSVEDITDGVAMVFVTTGDADGVRTRTANLAEMHNQHNGPAGSMGMMFPPTSTARWSKIDGGARLELVANNPDDIPKLQSEIRMHAGHLTGGTCEM
jgi:hypothetical protein